MPNVMIYSSVSPNMRATMQTMLDLNYSPAMVAGVCGNIQYESNYDPSTYKINKTIKSYGLCQWKDNSADGTNEGTKMRTWVGSDWKTNISGQIQYMDYTLNGGYLFLKSDMRDFPSTYDGALGVMRAFLIRYLLYTNYDEEVEKRTPYVKTVWDSMIIQI